MITLKVTFHKCIQDTRSAGSNAQQMVSRVPLTLEAQGRTHRNLYVDITQKRGGTFDKGDLQIGSLQGYSGPFNEWGFKQAVEKYYRGLAAHTQARLKVPVGINAPIIENIVLHESSAEIQVYD